MKIAIVQDKRKEATRVTIDKKQVAFPEASYYKLCDLFELLDAKEISYQESPLIKKSHWIMTHFDDALKELQSENQLLQYEIHSLTEKLRNANQRYAQTCDQLEKALVALNAPWWRRIWK